MTRDRQSADDRFGRVALVLAVWLAVALVLVTSPPAAVLVCR